MNDELLRMILAQQISIVRRLEKLEKASKGGSCCGYDKSQKYLDDLYKDSQKIATEITTYNYRILLQKDSEE